MRPDAPLTFCCPPLPGFSERLANIWVSVSDIPTGNLDPNMMETTECGTYNGAYTGPELTMICYTEVTGRYVNIMRMDLNSILTLCEVYVHGAYLDR